MANNRRYIQRGFGVGEVSPRLLGRGSERIMRQSCRTLKNAILDRYGSARKRPGWQTYRGPAPNKVERLFSFGYRDDVFVATLSLDGFGAYEATVIRTSDDTDVTGTSKQLDFWGASLDLSKMSYAQVEDRVFMAIEGQPMYVLELDQGEQKWNVRRIGLRPTDTKGGLQPPVVRSFSAPFGISIFEGANSVDNSINELPDENVGDRMHIRSDRPLFVQTEEDDGLALPSSAIFMVNHKSDTYWYRTTGLESPEVSDVHPLNNKTSQPVDGTSISDWYGPWYATDWDGVQSSLNIMDSLVVNSIVRIRTDGDPAYLFQAGTLIVGDPTGNFNPFGTVLEVLGQRGVGTDSTALCRVVKATGSSGSTTWSSSDPLYIFRPRPIDPSFTLFCIHRGHQTSLPSEVAVDTDRGISDTQGILRAYDSAANPGVDVSLNGGWVYWSSLDSQGWDDNRSRHFYNEQIAPSDYVYWTTRAVIHANPVDGFPSVLAVHQDRLWMTGYPGARQTITSSATGRYEDFLPGAEADDPLLLQVQADQGERIRWMHTGGDLLFGTDRSEWAISGQPITPTQIGIDAQSAYGAKRVNAIFAGPAVLFVGRDGRTIREMGFRFEVDRYEANDLARLSEHLFTTTDPADPMGVRQVAYVQYPEPLVVALRENGTLCVMTYNRENQITGWSEWTLDGPPIVDVTSVRSGDNDELWCVCYDGTDSTVLRMPLEEAGARFVDFGFGLTNGSHYSTSSVPDSVLWNVSLSNDSVTGQSTFVRNKDVVLDILGGNSPFPLEFSESAATVNGSGAVTLQCASVVNPTSIGSLSIGIPYAFEVEPQVPQPPDGSGVGEGRKKHYRGARVLMLESGALEVSGTIIFAKTPLEGDEEWVEHQWLSEQSDLRTPVFGTTRAVRCEIAAIVLDVERDGSD